MTDFSEKQIQDVWNKGISVENYDSSKYRKDIAGAWIQRDKYGLQEIYGWEIDHVYPKSKGGDANLINIRPMQWENNRCKADDFPEYNTAKTSETNKNIDSEGSFIVNEDLQAELKKLYKFE